MHNIGFFFQCKICALILVYQCHVHQFFFHISPLACNMLALTHSTIGLWMMESCHLLAWLMLSDVWVRQPVLLSVQ
jgi:hypothetical protein